MESYREHEPQQSAANTIPSLEALSTIRDFLPPMNTVLSLSELAEDMDETRESYLNALNCLQSIGVVDYTLDDDKLTFTKLIPTKLTPGAYLRLKNRHVEALHIQAHSLFRGRIAQLISLESMERQGQLEQGLSAELVMDVLMYLSGVENSLPLDTIADDMGESPRTIEFVLEELRDDKFIDYALNAGIVTILNKDEEFIRRYTSYQSIRP